MPSNIATGIGLSGQLETDNSGQLNRLAAEKAAAQERHAQQAAEQKKREDLEKEVYKNVAITADLTEPYLQRKWANKVTSEIADITEAIQNGDANVGVLGINAKNRLNVYKNALSQEDKAWQNIKTVMAKDPVGYSQFNDPQEIGGVRYNNVLDALNNDDSGYLNSEDGLREFMSKYGGMDNNMRINDDRSIALGLPKWQFSYEPIQQIDPYDAANLFTKANPQLHTQRVNIGKPTTLAGTNNVQQPYGYALDPNVINEEGNVIDSQFGVKEYWRQKGYEEWKKSNPNGTKNEFLNQYDGSNVVSAKEILARSLANKGVDRGTIPKPDKDKKSFSWGNGVLQNEYYRLTPITRDIDYKDRQFKMEGYQIDWNKAGSNQKEVLAPIPKGTIMFDPSGNEGKGEMVGVDKESAGEGVQIKAFLNGIYRSGQGKDENWYIAYTAKNDNYLGENDTYNTFYVPATNKQELIKASASLGMSQDEVQSMLDNGFSSRDGGSSEQSKTTTPKRKEIKESEIESKASAAGYSVEEYRKLLESNGINIVK